MDFAENYMNYVNHKNHFMIHNHMKVIEIEPDRAIAELTVCKDNLNPLNVIHGGAYFTLADVAASAAARSNGTQYVTLNSSFEFIRSAQAGTILATATVHHRGRTTCLMAVEVTDEKGTLLAEGKFTMFCLGESVPFE